MPPNNNMPPKNNNMPLKNNNMPLKNNNMPPNNNMPLKNNNMPPKRRFRPPKSEQEEKQILEGCIPKSTRSSTKWAFKIFSEWQIARVNKDPCIEQRSFKIDIDKVQTLDTNIANMSAETLNFWLTKFVQEVGKINGERYPGRSLYMIVAGLQRHLGESGNAIRLVN